MRKLYHSAGRFSDEKGQFDILFTRGEADIMMGMGAEPGEFADKLIWQLHKEAMNLNTHVSDVRAEFKTNKYYPFGVGKYAVSNMTSTTRLVVGVAYYPPDQIERSEIYDNARWHTMSMAEAEQQV